MAEPKMIKVASRLPMAVALTEPHPNPAKPGESPALRSVVLAGAGHPGEETVSTVDAEVFGAWQSANARHEWLKNELVREVPDDYEPGPASYGHEPGLETLSKDKGNTKLAQQGTGADEAAPVKASEMAATSETPNDDSPRSQVGPNAAKAAPVPPTAPAPKA